MTAESQSWESISRRNMREIDVLVTIRYSDHVDEQAAMWCIFNLDEYIHDVGYNDDELSVTSKVVARREEDK